MAKLGKSTQDAYNPEKWLILQALLKNCFAEGIASDVNDFSPEIFLSPQDFIRIILTLPGELATGLIVYSHVVATVVASPLGNWGFWT